ncbi:hypothetical protein Tco_0150111 [Tanacetum coccineum]
MTTLADKAILSGADNSPPMLEKDMYDSWKNRMELYMMNRQHGRMILESVENGPLIWPTIEENGVTGPKKYSELTNAVKFSWICDVKGNKFHSLRITTRGLMTCLPIIERKDLWEIIPISCKEFIDKTGKRVENYTMNSIELIIKKEETLCDDPIDVINHMMSFLSAIVTSRYPTTNNQLRNSLNPRQQATINDGRVTLQPVQGRQISFAMGTTRTYTPGASGSNSTGKQRTVICYNSNGQILHEEELAFLADPRTAEGQATQTVITHKAAYQADDLDIYDFDCDERNTAKVALLANLSHYGSYALTEE